MKRSLLATSVAAILLAIGTAPATAADPEITDRGPMSFDSMDTDKDGHVSSDEFRKAHEERKRLREQSQQRYQYRNMDEAPRHADIDTDKDGRVSREEFQAHQQQREQQRAERMEQREQEREERMKQHKQERAEREQEREKRHRESMERHQKHMDEMQQKRYEQPAGSMGSGGGKGSGKR